MVGVCRANTPQGILKPIDRRLHPAALLGYRLAQRFDFIDSLFKLLPVGRLQQFHIPVKILCLNNGYLGMVRQWQEMFHGNRFAESYVDARPDFVKLAEAYGHVGIQVKSPSDVEPALREAFVKHKNELVFLDFLTDKTANVFPMVAAGKGLSEMILAEDL